MILPESPSGSPKRSPQEPRSFAPKETAHLFWPQGRSTMPDSKTAAGAYDRIKSHEDLCAERYANIHATLGEIKADAKTQNRLIIGILLALVGWMGVQLWSGQVHPVAAAQAIAGKL